MGSVNDYLTRKHLTPAQLREVADRLEEETAHRGLLIRFAAALEARKLRRLASNTTEAG